MSRTSDYTDNLQLCLRNARLQLQAFRSGEKYVQMKEQHKKTTRQLENDIKSLKKELSLAHAETVRVRNIWFEQSEILEKERQAEREKLEKALHQMEERALKAEARVAELETKVSEQRKELYNLGTQLEEEKRKNQKLTAQLNQDYENSSISSSMSLKPKKKIQNNREKTGRKPGGQPGHTGHSRKKGSIIFFVGLTLQRYMFS